MGRTIVISGIATVLGAALLMLYVSRTQAAKLTEGSGRLEQLFVVTPESGPIVVSLESVEVYEGRGNEALWRATSRDARTGQQLARAIEVRWRSCVPAAPSSMWCVVAHGDDVELVGLPKFEVIANFAALEAKAGQHLIDAKSLRAPGGALVVTLGDGKHAQLDPKTLTLSPEVTLPAPAAPAWATELIACPIEGTERKGLCTEDRFRALTRHDSGDGFLNPQPIGRGAGRTAVVVSTSVDPKGDLRELVLLGEDMKPQATMKLETPQAWWKPEHFWFLDDGKLLLVSMMNPDVVFGFDLEQGKELWRAHH